MDAERIVKVSEQAIRNLIDSCRIDVHDKVTTEHRAEQRWPFPGTIELWLPDDCYGERHVLATLHNLSEHGFAMRTRRPIPSGTRISMALHQPELSCYGQVIVRHCTRAPVGYLIGCEFIFDATSDSESAPE